MKLETEDIFHFKHLPYVNKISKITQNDSPLISSDSFEEDQHEIDLTYESCYVLNLQFNPS